MPYRPHTIDQGKLQQLPAGQALDVGGWTLPTSGGTENYILTADAGGNAVWAEMAPDVGDPTAADQLLVSTGSGAAGWVAQPPCWDLPAPTADNTVLTGASDGSMNWATDLTGLTSLTVDNITINGAAITSDTGLISFSNENLSTLGSVGIGTASPRNALEVARLDSNWVTSIRVGGITAGDQTVGAGVETSRHQILFSSYRDNVPDTVGAKLVAINYAAYSAPDEWSVQSTELVFYTLGAVPSDSDDTVERMRITSDGKVCIGTSSADSQSMLDVKAVAATGTRGSQLHLHTDTDDEGLYAGSWLAGYAVISTGAYYHSAGTTYYVQEVDASSIKFNGSEMQFNCDSGLTVGATFVATTRLTVNTTGVTVAGTLTVGSWTIASPASAGQVLQAGGANAATWTTSLTGLQYLKVDNIIIDGATIWSNTGAINFSNEDLSTTGTLTVGPASRYGYARIDVESPYAGGYFGAQMHLHSANNAYGLFAGSWGSTAAVIACGAHYWSGGNWLARSSTASGIYFGAGYMSIAANTGLTDGNSYSPNYVFTANTSGITVTGNLTVTGDASAANITASRAFIGAQANSGGNRIYNDVYSYKGPNGASNGTMKITLPVSWTSTMLTIRIRGYNYSRKSGPWEVIVGGYNYSSGAWYNHSAILKGAACPFTSVRLAHDGSKCCILLGATDTRWDYPQVHIVEVTTGYGSQAGFETGWGASIIASETGISNIVTCKTDLSPRRLLGDETIFVNKATGNDLVNSGSSTYPFATVARAIEELNTMFIGEHNVTVDTGPGVYTHTSPLEFRHPFGAQVTFDGDAETITGESTTSISGTDNNLSTVSGNLDYYNATITFAGGTTLSAGDYILIYNAAGGANPAALNGCHKVESYSSNVATIRIVHRAGSAHASGTVNFDCVLVRTVLSFTGSNGLKADGPYHLGHWKDLVIQGNENNANCDYGVWTLNSPLIRLSSTTGIRGWQRGIYAQNNAMVFADYAFISCCHQYGVMSNNGATVNLRWGYVSGCNNAGIYAQTGATISANGAHVTGVGASGVLSSDGSWIDFSGGYIKHATNNVLYAANSAGILAQAEDVSATQVYYDSTATCSPARDTTGNYGAVMRGGPY